MNLRGTSSSSTITGEATPRSNHNKLFMNQSGVIITPSRMATRNSRGFAADCRALVQGCREKFRMECEISTPSSYGRKNGASPGSGAKESPNRNSSTGSAKSQLHVEFIENGEVKEKREKYLTAKYGSHQMSLIRKRLSVEMWLYDELQKLYQEGDSSAAAAPEIEIDLDEVLDMDGDVERRKFLQGLLTGAKESQDIINKFIEDVIEKAKTL